MKKSIILFIAAAAVLSCAKETSRIEQTIDNTPKGKGVTINVLAGKESTKTVVVDGEIPSVQWAAEDKVKVFEVMDGVIKGNADSQNASISEGKASFKTTLDWAAAGGASYQYSAVYPAASVKYESSHYYIVLPWKQQLTGGNLSADSDILFSTVLDHGASRVTEEESVEFSFRRLGTLVRLTLAGINSGEKIQQVTIKAPVSIAGSIQFDPVTGTVDSGTAFDKDASSEVTLVLGDMVATGTDVVWFRVMSERDWGQAGDEVSFEVITDKNVYRKTVSSPTIQFADGGFTKFGVNLGSSIVAPLSVPYSNDFADNVNGWFFIDADGDGYNWGLDSGNLESASFDDAAGSLTPDNWVFTPGIQLTDNNYLSFWIRAKHNEDFAEHYAVYISQQPPVSATLADCAVLMPETEFPNGDYVELGPDGVFQHYVIKIPDAYESKTVYIGFRHFNCEGLYWLCFDNISIVQGEPVAGANAVYEDYLGLWNNGSDTYTIQEKNHGTSYYISGFDGQGSYRIEALFNHGRLEMKEQVVYTDEDNDIAFQGQNSTEHSFYKGFTSIGSRIVFFATYNPITHNLDITPHEKFDGYIWVSYSDHSFSQSGSNGILPEVLVKDPNTYVYLETFNANPTGWSWFDVDGDGHGWELTDDENEYYSAPYALCSRSWDQEGLQPDNYAFTPAIDLTADNYLSFWVNANQDYYEEHYAVYIGTEVPSLQNLGDRTLLFDQVYSKNPVDAHLVEHLSNGYQHYVIQIPPAFANQTVYIGFRHYDTDDQLYLVIDNVAVIEGVPVFN